MTEDNSASLYKYLVSRFDKATIEANMQKALKEFQEWKRSTISGYDLERGYIIIKAEVFAPSHFDDMPKACDLTVRFNDTELKTLTCIDKEGTTHILKYKDTHRFKLDHIRMKDNKIKQERKDWLK